MVKPGLKELFEQHALPRMLSFDFPPVAQGTHLGHQVFVTTCSSFPLPSRVHEWLS